jgi:hypothetical protein
MSDRQRLLALYVPPEGFALESFLATTYRADLEFIEEELLPVALGVKAPVSRARAFRSELERRLAACDVTILHDMRGCDRPIRLSRRIDLLPVPRPKLHSKVVLLVWTRAVEGGAPERRVRLLVGSANLTREGFRENHEVMAALDFGSGHRTPRRLLHDVLAHLRQVGAETPSPRLDAQMANVEQLTVSLPAGIDSTEWPWRFADAQQVVPSLAEAWRVPGAEPPERIIIVSPFWPTGEQPEEPVVRLVQAIGTPSRVELVCESAQPSGLPLVPPTLPPRLRDRLGCPVFVRLALHGAGPSAGDAGDDTEDAALGAPADGEARRALHAKLVIVLGRTRAALYAGSSNCTRRGMSLGGPANREAGFVYRLGKKELPLIEQLLAFASEPVEVRAGQPFATEPPPQEPEGPAPVFLLEALAEDGAIRIRFRPGEAVPADLEMLMRDPVSVDAPPWPLLASAARPLGGEVSVPVPEGRQVDSSVEVRWDGHAAWFPVRFDDKDALPLVPAGRRPTEGELIDYYLTGRDPDGEAEGLSSAAGQFEAVVDEVVDTRRILSYFIRRFVQAVPGIEAEVRRGGYAEPSLRAALFGPASPLALARQALSSIGRRSPDEPAKTPTAAGFQLVEIAAALLRCRTTFAEGPLRDLCERAARECCTMLDGLARQHPGLGQGPFKLYRDALLGERM